MYLFGREFLLGVGISGIGAVFFILAMNLAEVSDDPFGPALAPQWIAVATIVLGVAQAIVAIVGREQATDAPEEVSIGLTIGGFLRACAIVAVGALHMFLFSAVGFMVASIVTLYLLLALFADWRNLKWLAVALVGGIAFHLVFIELMSLYDPNAVLRLRDFGLN